VPFRPSLGAEFCEGLGDWGKIQIVAEPKQIILKQEEPLALRWFLWAVLAVTGFYLSGLLWGVLGQFSDIILLVFLAWLLSFVLEPWVSRLSSFGLPRVLGAGIVYLLVAGTLALAGFIFVPLLAQQTSSFVSALALSQQEAPNWILSLQQNLSSNGVNVDLNALVRGQINSFQTFSALTSTSVVALAASILSILFYAFLVLIFSFYFVLDGEHLWRLMLAHMPKRYHDELLFVSRAVATSFSGFLRIQVLLGIMMGVITFITLAAFGVEFAVTAATFAGLIMVVPVLGPPLSMVPPTLATLVTQPDKTWIVFLFLFLAQAITVNIIGPLFFKRSIGIHPVLVLTSFLIGLKVAGGWGAIFAVPIAAILLIIGSQLLRHWYGPGRRVPELDWPL